MGVLKDDQAIKNSIKGKLSSIVSELSEVESKDADEFVTWFLDKSKLYKKSKLKERFTNLPYLMQRGDIIRVKFGINIGDEISDSGTDSHFAIYWTQNGFKIIVIPISAVERKDDFTVNLGKIPGLPKETDTFAKIDMIHSINLRRISRIANVKDGKISLNDINPDIIKYISDRIIDKLL